MTHIGCIRSKRAAEDLTGSAYWYASVRFAIESAEAWRLVASFKRAGVGRLNLQPQVRPECELSTASAIASVLFAITTIG